MVSRKRFVVRRKRFLPSRKQLIPMRHRLVPAGNFLVPAGNGLVPARNQTVPARKKGHFCLEKPVLGRKSPFWPLKGPFSLTPHPSSRPAALAIDLRRHRLFAGCGNKLMVMLDFLLLAARWHSSASFVGHSESLKNSGFST